MAKKFTFREITEKEELEEIFRFRYEVYSNCHLNVFIHKNEQHIDMDNYDVHSRHYALTDGNVNAGCFRIVYPKQKLTNEDVLEIGIKYQLLSQEEYFNKNGKAPYPFLSYDGIPQSYWNYYNELQMRNENITEGSRLVLHPDYRSLRTSKFITECSVAVFTLDCIGKTNAVIYCRPDHTKFWKHYGFVSIAHTERFEFEGFQAEIITIPLSKSLSDSTIPPQFHSKFENMANELQSTGKIEREI